jgi:hypothetical protein
VVSARGPIDPTTLTPPERATLAALYVAQVTTWMIDHLDGTAPVLLDGPIVRNPVICGVIAALQPPHAVHVNVDELEGTARGAWVLSRWTGTHAWTPKAASIFAPENLDLRSYQRRWLARLDQPCEQPVA